MLPDIDGVRVLKYIRALVSIRTLPVIILSNSYLGEAVRARLFRIAEFEAEAGAIGAFSILMEPPSWRAK